MPQAAYFRLEHTSFNRKEWGNGRVAAAARYGANRNKLGHVATVGIEVGRTSYDAARTFMKLEAMNTRKNGRLGDGLLVSFPVEVAEGDRLALMERFLFKVTMGGRTYAQAWEHRDHPHNPHFHAIVVDRDRLTGKAVGMFGHSRSYREKKGLEPNVTVWMRQQWEEAQNEFYAERGYDLVADRRSNMERGMEAPQEHRGFNDNLEPAPELDTVVGPETEDAQAGEDDVSLIEREPDERISSAGNDVRLLASTLTELRRLKDAQARITEAEAIFQSRARVRDTAVYEAVQFDVKASYIEQDAYRANQQLARHQTGSGKLKGFGLSVFGMEFKTEARRQAELARQEAEAAQARAEYAAREKREYTYHVGRTEQEALEAEERVLQRRNELRAIYGDENDLRRAEATFERTITKVLTETTLEQAKGAYEDGELTVDEYHAFLEAGGYEVELAEAREHEL